MNDLNLEVELGKIKLKNPLITASGTFGFGEEIKIYMKPEIVGAITVKGITVNPSKGNPSPRIVETPAGLLNSIGLENPGIETFIKEKLPLIKELKVPVMVNISGYSIKDFSVLAKRLNPYRDIIKALEINVSCPNISGGGMAFGTDSKLIYRVVEEVKNNFPGPIITKLSPNVTDIVEIACAAESAGTDIISLINTLLGMAIDINSKRPELGNIFGGLSGPAIKPVALRMVYQLYENIEIPIIGMGGIMKGEDVIEFMLAGAKAVGIGTANLVEPAACKNILNEIKDYLISNNINNISALVGKAHNIKEG
ncbi:MAG: dihydroorotate dehydrogenase [Bacillota bacterium]